MFNQTQIKLWIQAAKQAWHACERQTCLIWLSEKRTKTKQSIFHQTREQKKCFIDCLMAFKLYQTRQNTITRHQTRCPNRKMFGHQAMFGDQRSKRQLSILFTVANSHYQPN